MKPTPLELFATAHIDIPKLIEEGNFRETIYRASLVTWVCNAQPSSANWALVEDLVKQVLKRWESEMDWGAIQEPVTAARAEFEAWAATNKPA